MKRWNVIGIVSGSKYLGEYEAETAEEAIQKALEEKGGPISVCHQCSDECEDGEVSEAIADEIKDNSDDHIP